MNTPHFYTPDQLSKEGGSGVRMGTPDGKWVMARPEGWQGLMLGRRLKAAWLVFSGKADVLQWEGGQ